MPGSDLDSSRLRGVNLFLVGLMGSGKTTVGQELAPRLGYRFLDTDRLIEQLAQQSISQIFATQGEAAFRILEAQVLAEVATFSRLVVATGGGIVLQPQNWSYLHHGVVVWLDVPVDRLVQRLQPDSHNRPLLQTPDPAATLTTLMQQRRSLYAQADVHVHVSDSTTPQQVSQQVWQQVSARIRSQSVVDPI